MKQDAQSETNDSQEFDASAIESLCISQIDIKKKKSSTEH